MGVSKKENSAISPNHYKQGGLELITIWKKKLTPEEFKGLCKGNILKYVLRADFKDGLKDYKKAAVYLKWLIKMEEEEKRK